MRYCVGICLISVLLFGHKLNLFVFEENNKVILNAYFASSAPCKECKVEIFDAQEKPLQLALTNEKGEFSFEKKEKQYSIKVEALGGHAAVTTYESNEHPVRQTSPYGMNANVQTVLALMALAALFILLKRVAK